MINVNFGNVSAGVLFSKSRINENGGKVPMKKEIIAAYLKGFSK